MSRIHLFVISLILLSFSQEISAQYVWSNNFNFIKELKEKSVFKVDSSSSVELEKQKILTFLQLKGFFFANLDSQFFNASKDSLFCNWNLGNSYQSINISTKNVPEEVASILNFKEPNSKIDLINFKVLCDKILNYYSNSGYPFALVFFDSILADSHRIQASLVIQKGPLMLFDSLDFAGNSELKLNYLRSFCNIKIGDVYNESVLKNINPILSELPYLQITRPIGIYFYGNKAKPYLYLDKKKASTFDGIIGFAPKSSINNQLVITGDINLKLQNILGSGKYFELGFRSFLNGSQDLQLKFNWPYFLKSRIGLDYTFKLLRFDSIYIDLNNEIGFNYRGFGRNVFKVLYQFQRMSLLNVDTIAVLQNRRLPAFHDLKTDLIGFNFKLNRTNHFFNPTKGQNVEIECLAGSRKILKNSIINDLKIIGVDQINYNLYDSVKIQSYQFKLRLNAAWFFPIYKMFVLKTNLMAGLVHSEQIFQNELFRIGGLKTLRGFDEQSIFADRFLLGNLELKYLIQENSSFVLFYNAAMVKNSLAQNFQYDVPWGIGAGMNIETKAGIFSLFYAIGAQKNNPVQFKSARIHFGFVNYF